MNFSPLNVVMVAAGIILIYAALKDVDPRTVIQNALKGKATPGKSTIAPPSAVTPPTPTTPIPPPANTAFFPSV